MDWTKKGKDRYGGDAGGRGGGEHLVVEMKNASTSEDIFEIRVRQAGKFACDKQRMSARGTVIPETWGEMTGRGGQEQRTQIANRIAQSLSIGSR